MRGCAVYQRLVLKDYVRADDTLEYLLEFVDEVCLDVLTEELTRHTERHLHSDE